MRPLFRFAGILAFASAVARADTYQISDVGYDQGRNFPIGIDDSGHVVLTAIGCPGPDQCYTVFTYGQSSYTTYTIPAFSFDDGYACDPVVAGIQNSRTGRCNNGRFVFTGITATTMPAVFIGPDPVLSFYPGDSINYLLNSRGDFVFDDTNFDHVYYARDLTTAATPEPSSIALLGTGLLGVVSAVKGHHETAITGVPARVAVEAPHGMQATPVDG